MTDSAALLSPDSTVLQLSLPQTDATHAFEIGLVRRAVLPRYETGGGSTKASEVMYRRRVREASLDDVTESLDDLAEAVSASTIYVVVAARFPTHDDSLSALVRRWSREVPQSASRFDARANLHRVVESMTRGEERSPQLLDAAAGALERLRARKGESVDDWAEKLAPTFFADLDRLD